MIISGAYIAAILLAKTTLSLGCLNPAIGISTTIVMTFNGDTEGIKWIWLYGLIPFAGSLVGVIFHEFIYKKVVDSI